MLDTVFLRAGLLRQGEDALLNPGEIGGVPAGVAVGVEGQGPGDGVPFVQGGQGVPEDVYKRQT